MARVRVSSTKGTPAPLCPETRTELPPIPAVTPSEVCRELRGLAGFGKSPNLLKLNAGKHQSHALPTPRSAPASATERPTGFSVSTAAPNSLLAARTYYTVHPLRNYSLRRLGSQSG